GSVIVGEPIECPHSRHVNGYIFKPRGRLLPLSAAAAIVRANVGAVTIAMRSVVGEHMGGVLVGNDDELLPAPGHPEAGQRVTVGAVVQLPPGARKVEPSMLASWANVAKLCRIVFLSRNVSAQRS